MDRVRNRGGIVIPAHVDRRSYSIISQLGFIPPDLEIKVVELSSHCSPEIAVNELGLEGFRFPSLFRCPFSFSNRLSYYFFYVFFFPQLGGI